MRVKALPPAATGAAVALAVFIAMLALCWPLVADYFPIHDDLALEATATALGGPVQPSTWFTDGYHAFFRSFPEWGWEEANFLRPLAQALFWLHYQLAGSRFASQLVCGYAAHALVVGIVAWFALGVLRLTRLYAAVAVLVAALNPALWTPFLGQYSIAPLLQLPVYQTEIVCAALMLLAMIAFLRGAFGTFALVATAALLLKETAITVPIAALVLFCLAAASQGRGTWRRAFWLALPLIVWVGIKVFVFRYGFSSYQTTSTRPYELLFEPIRNLLLWPSGLYEGPLGATRAALVARDGSTLVAHGIELALNLAWWLAVALALLAGCRALPRRGAGEPPAPWLVALVFAFANLAFVVVLVATQLRFGYFWFAVGPAAMFAAWGQRKRPALHPALATLLAVAVASSQVLAVTRMFEPASLADYRLVRRAAHSLAALLASLPPTVKTAYLLDDVVVQVPAPEYLARIAGFQGRLVLVNIVRPVIGCVDPDPNAAAKARYALQQQGGENPRATVLDYTAPACFEPPWNVATAGQFDGLLLRRGDTITYHYPKLRIAPDASAGSRDYDVGRHWSATFTDPTCAAPGACAWIGLVPDQARYALIPLNVASQQ